MKHVIKSKTKGYVVGPYMDISAKNMEQLWTSMDRNSLYFITLIFERLIVKSVLIEFTSLIKTIVQYH